MAVTEIKHRDDEMVEEVKEILTDAVDQKFVSVVVIGENGDGKIRIQASRNKDVVAKLGALEVAKHEMLENW